MEQALPRTLPNYLLELQSEGRTSFTRAEAVGRPASASFLPQAAAVASLNHFGYD